MKSFQARPSISEPIFRKLVMVAIAFRDVGCWNMMGDKEVFAVKDPETGTVWYNVVMGSEGTLFGLAAYPGAEGYRSLRETMRLAQNGSFEEAMLLTNVLVTFENRAELPPEIKNIYRGYGMGFKEASGWPNFLSHDPYMFPYVISETQAKALITVLEQSVFVAARFMNEGMPPFCIRRRILTRVQANLGEWHDDWTAIPKPPDPPAVKVPERESEDLVHALTSRAGKLGTWEVDSTMSPIPVAEPGTRPYFPRVPLIVDADTGYLFHMTVARPEEFPASLLTSIAENIERFGAPKLILVRDRGIYELLAPACYRAGTILMVPKTFKQIPLIKRHMRETMG